jgi:hypothetical protein
VSAQHPEIACRRWRARLFSVCCIGGGFRTIARGEGQTRSSWRTLTRVQRYSHLAPQHLQDAVARLVGTPTRVALARNLAR